MPVLDVPAVVGACSMWAGGGVGSASCLAPKGHSDQPSARHGVIPVAVHSETQTSVSDEHRIAIEPPEKTAS